MSPPSELSSEFILQLKRELEEDMRLYEELPARIAQRKRRYEAALLFAPAGFNPDAPVVEVHSETAQPFELENDVEQDGQNAASWPNAIMHVLDALDAGISHKELLATAAREFRLSRSVGDKGFYHAVRRLNERKLLIKHGGLLYSARSVQRIQARGEDLPSGGTETRPGGSAAIVLEVLREHPHGLTGPDLRDAVRKVPDAPKSLKEHSHYIYNVLAPMLGAGSIVKDGAVYKLPQKGEAPVGTGASFQSDPMP